MGVLKGQRISFIFSNLFCDGQKRFREDSKKKIERILGGFWR